MPNGAECGVTDETGQWLMVLAAAAVTYLWRGLGVVVAGRFSADSEIVRWVGFVAYAMLAALFTRMILLPAGQLADVPLVWRLGVLAVAVAVWRFAGRNIVIGTLSGVAVLIALNYGGAW